MATQVDCQRTAAVCTADTLNGRSEGAQERPFSRTRLRHLLTGFACAALLGTVAVSVPAAADPSDSNSGTSTVSPQPSSASEAKQAWLDAAQESEAANEALLVAQENEEQAALAADSAKITEAQAALRADTAQAEAVAAAAKFEAYREDLATFASASFRGARLGQLSALLTAESSSDYLDEISSLDQVAGGTRLLMIEALEAKDAAETASNTAVAARQDAESATEAAASALAAAKKATEDVAERKATLDAKVETYHRLYSTLSGQERAAAMAAQQSAWEEQARLAADQAAAQQQSAEIAGTDQADTAGGAADATAPQADAADAPADAAPGDAVVNVTTQIVIEAALSKLGMPYVYGASGPNSYDCSGLTSWAWAQAGVKLPRTSSGQASLPVVPLDQLRPGDLITYYSPVHHVALYIGNGQIIHASTEGKPVFITSMYKGGPYPVGHRVQY